ncbi:hypothetical protein SGPA1_40825 [Streptomyces misionensis JCM 4497]
MSRVAVLAPRARLGPRWLSRPGDRRPEVWDGHGGSGERRLEQAPVHRGGRGCGGRGRGAVAGRSSPDRRAGRGPAAAARRPLRGAAPAVRGHLHLHPGRRHRHRARLLRPAVGRDHGVRHAHRGPRPVVPRRAPGRAHAVRGGRAAGRRGDGRTPGGPAGPRHPEHRGRRALPSVGAPLRALAAQRELRVRQCRRASDRRLGRPGRAHRPGHAQLPGARSGPGGAARTPVHDRSGRPAPARGGPRHGHRLHVPSGPGEGHAHRDRPGAHPAGRGAAAPDLPPRRAARLPGQRGRRHDRGLRLRPALRPADDRRPAVHGLLGGRHQLPGADPGHGRRPVRLPGQPRPQQPGEVRGGGRRGPAAAAGHGAGRRGLPAADRVLPGRPAAVRGEPALGHGHRLPRRHRSRGTAARRRAVRVTRRRLRAAAVAPGGSPRWPPAPAGRAPAR